jgi:hypothetical protein
MDSKELKNLIKAANAYSNKYKGQTNIVISVAGIVEKGKDIDIVDDIALFEGPKECLIMTLEEMLKMLKKEKKEYITWGE